MVGVGAFPHAVLGRGQVGGVAGEHVGEYRHPFVEVALCRALGLVCLPLALELAESGQLGGRPGQWQRVGALGVRGDHHQHVAGPAAGGPA